MKAILNWRYYVIHLLVIAGMLGIIGACGEPAPLMSVTEYLLQTALYLFGTVISFYVLYRCVRRWESRGELPEFTNLESEQ